MFSAYNDDPRVWDPATGSVTLAPFAGYNIFCAGHSALPDGRLLLSGGHIANSVGLRHASIFDPFTNQWTRLPDMNAGRWYPTNTTLANGDVLVVSGDVDTYSGRNRLPQVWETAHGRWRDLVNAQLDLPLYPFMHAAPDGRVFMAGPNQTSQYLATSGTGAWTTGPSSGIGYRDYGTSVMYDDGKVLLVGGADPPTASAEVIDLKASTPRWRQVSPMANRRRQLNATILADGKVLATGGSSGNGFDNSAAPVYAAEIWDPATETWSAAASSARYRGYHSSALLLPDGRVFSGGGQGELNFEVYTPSYLLNGARPTIASAPESISYGQQFSISTPDAESIAKVHLIKLSSVTHAFNMDQRINRLAFSPVAGGLTVSAPASGNESPPGPYMLFVLNSHGVPSIARIVRIGPAAAAVPAAPSQLSASPSNALVRLTWDRVEGATAYKVFRSTTPDTYTSPLFTAPTASYSDASVSNGITYYYTVRATNSMGDSLRSNAVSARPDSSFVTTTATFIKSDATTQGSWKGRYGADGYHIVNEAVSYPAYAQVSVSGALTYTWAASTSDVRASQKPSSGTDRIASTWYSDGPFTIDVALTDGRPHKVGVYALDWDRRGRVQTIDVVDPLTNVRLDNQVLSGFDGGVYLVWEVSGHVQIRVSKDAYVGDNGVSAALFFDSPGTTANVSPAVSVTTPSPGATFTAPATVTITAAAGDTDGTVSKVEFFQGTTKLGEDLTDDPYSYTWNNVAAGSYSLTARATDNTGAAATSTAVGITVTAAPNTPPSVSVTAPAPDATFTAPATVTITAAAGDTDGTVSKVEFFQGTTKLGEDLTDPYSYTWNNVAAGSYSLTAQATDNTGAAATSAAVGITVTAAPNTPPSVSVTAPAPDATFTAPATVTITAAAGDTDGTVSKVEFFQGTTKLGEDLTDPYSYTWNNVAAGSYSLTARATDNTGAAATSTAVGITVTATAPPPGSASARFIGVDNSTQGNWKGRYGADGYHIVNNALSYPNYAQVSVTNAPSYTWAEPTADVRALQKPGTTDRIASTWYSSTSFTIDMKLPDDRSHRVAVYALDWESGGRAQTIEVFDAAANTRLDIRRISGFGGGQYFVWELTGHVQFRITKDAGDNAVAAGLFFDTVSSNTAPIVSMTAPVAGASYEAPATVVMDATASDTDGTISKVEFFQGVMKLGEDASAPYSYIWSNVAAGTYTLTASAIDNTGAATTSTAPVGSRPQRSACGSICTERQRTVAHGGPHLTRT